MKRREPGVDTVGSPARQGDAVPPGRAGGIRALDQRRGAGGSSTVSIT
jgi:hypothetical protein